MSLQGSLSDIEVVCGELLDDDGFLVTLGAARGVVFSDDDSSACMCRGGVGRRIRRRCWPGCCWLSCSRGF